LTAMSHAAAARGRRFYSFPNIMVASFIVF
jgi:hypothetical protein